MGFDNNNFSHKREQFLELKVVSTKPAVSSLKILAGFASTHHADGQLGRSVGGILGDWCSVLLYSDVEFYTTLYLLTLL